MGDADYLYAFQKLVMPIAYEFSPELVISERPLSGYELKLIVAKYQLASTLPTEMT